MSTASTRREIANAVQDLVTIAPIEALSGPHAH